MSPETIGATTQRPNMKPKIVVVGYDFSPAGATAVKTALELAQNVEAERIHLVHIVDRSVIDVPHPASIPPPDPTTLEANRKARAAQSLEAITAANLHITREVRSGIPARDLPEAVKDAGGDVVVVASRGHGAVYNALFGSVTNALVRSAPCPVLVVDEEHKNVDFSVVVAGVDLSPISREVVELAVSYTKPGGHTELVSAYEPPLVMEDEDELLPRLPSEEDREAFRKARENAVRALIPDVQPMPKIGVEAFAKAPAANALIDCAELLSANLLVVGSSGHNAWHRFFIGSTTNRVLAAAPCPVLVVPHHHE